MLLKFVNKGLEKLVVTETSRALRNPVGVIHGQLWQNVLQLIHLTLPLLHTSNEIVRVRLTVIK